MKLSNKSKVISKGTSYSDKYEARRNQRLSNSKRSNTNAAMNRLGQKHGSLNLASVSGMAMTKAQKKALLKRKAREERRQKRANTHMAGSDDDWESASDDEENKEEEIK